MTTPSSSLEAVWADIDRRKAELADAWPAGWPTPQRVWTFDSCADYLVLFSPSDALRAVQMLPWLPLVAMPCLNGVRVTLASRAHSAAPGQARFAGRLVPLHGANLAGLMLGDYLQGYVRVGRWLLCVQIPGRRSAGRSALDPSPPTYV